jgi:hypothetical protein
MNLDCIVQPTFLTHNKSAKVFQKNEILVQSSETTRLDTLLRAISCLASKRLY